MSGRPSPDQEPVADVPSSAPASETVGDPAPRPQGEPVLQPRLKGGLADRLEVVVPVLGYLVATVTGASTSSLAAPLLRARLNHPAVTMLGAPRPVRSDEWLTQTPIELSTIAHGSPVVSPLAHSPDLIFQVSSGGPFETVLFLEGNLLRLGPWLPDAMVFAAFRAFPILLLLLTLPPLLRRLSVPRSLSWLAVALTLLAPATLWWSFMPVRIGAFAAAGSYFLVLARDRYAVSSRLGGTLWAVAAGLCIARLGTYYVPWSLTIGVPLAAAVALFLLLDRERRIAALLSLGVGAATSLVLLAGVFWDNHAALSAELDTVYPGLRRSSGAALAPFQLFGAPGLSVMQGTANPVMSNQSEISSAFLLCALWAAILWSHRRRDLPLPQRAAALVLAGFTTLWMSWAMLSWGNFGSKMPLLSLVPPERAGQTVGFVASFLVCVVLAQVRFESLPRLAPVAALATTAVTAYGVSDLRHAYPQLSTVSIWAAAVLTGALVGMITLWPTRWLPIVAATLVVGLIGYHVNPIVFGLGELRDGAAAHAAQRFADQADRDGGRYATDIWGTSALLVANGVPSVTGYQVTGPVRSQWQRLDPGDTYEQQWNRGSSYLQMSFGPEGSPTTIENPGNDIIRINVDPCVLRATLDVTHIISARRLTHSCLRQVETFRWSGVVNRVYAVS